MKYAFPVERGSLVRGIPTSYAAPPMSSEFVPDSDPPPVWPDAEGTVRGFKFTPLSRSAPKAARMDPKLSKCSPGSTRSVMAGRANASSLKRNSPRVSLNDRRQTPESQSRRHRGSCAPPGPLLPRFVFVGGCATGLRITDPASAPVRVTRDVDVIADLASYGEYSALGERLRSLGFREDDSEGAPACRWAAGDLLLDVMPATGSPLGFTKPLVCGGDPAIARVRTGSRRPHPSGDRPALPSHQVRGVSRARSRRLLYELGPRGHGERRRRPN